MYLYILNYDFFPVLTVFDPMSLFLVTALSPCWPIIRSVYVFEITTTIKRVTPPRWQRSYRRAPLWLPRLFAWLEKGHSECAVAILARDLGTDGTNHRICDCWIYLASPRDMPLYLCTAQKNPRRGSLEELLWSKHNGLEACFFFGGGGIAVCTFAVCSQQLSECRFQKVCAYITQQEKAKQTWNLFHPYVNSRTKKSTTITIPNRGGRSLGVKVNGQVGHHSV